MEDSWRIATSDSRRDPLRDAYAEHHLRLFRLAYLLSGDRWLAEDLAQEAFVRAAGKLKDLAEDEWGPYLRTVVMNLWRRSVRRRLLEQRSRGPSASDWYTPSGVEERDEAWNLILRLPPRQRACLVLRYYEDLADHEIATVLGCSIGTVKSQSSRALAKLRKEVESHEQRR